MNSANFFDVTEMSTDTNEMFDVLAERAFWEAAHRRSERRERVSNRFKKNLKRRKRLVKDKDYTLQVGMGKKTKERYMYHRKELDKRTPSSFKKEIFCGEKALAAYYAEEAESLIS